MKKSGLRTAGVAALVLCMLSWMHPAAATELSATDTRSEDSTYTVVSTGSELETALAQGCTNIRLGGDVTTMAQSYVITANLTLDLQGHTWNITGTDVYDDSILWASTEDNLTICNGKIYADTEGSYLIWKGAGTFTLTDMTMNGKVGLGGSTEDKEETLTASVDRCTITRTEAAPEGEFPNGDYSALHILSENVHITQLTESTFTGYGYGIVSVGATIDLIQNCTVTGVVGAGIDAGGTIGKITDCNIRSQTAGVCAIANYGTIQSLGTNTLTGDVSNYNGTIYVSAPGSYVAKSNAFLANEGWTISGGTIIPLEMCADGWVYVSTGDELNTALVYKCSQIRLNNDVTTEAKTYYISRNLTLDLQGHTWNITGTDVYDDPILWARTEDKLTVCNGTIKADTEGSYLIWKGAGTLTLTDMTMNGKVGLGGSTEDKEVTLTASVDRCTITRTEAAPEGESPNGDYSALHILSENVHITQLTESTFTGYGYGIVSVDATIDLIQNCTVTGMVGRGMCSSGSTIGKIENCTINNRMDDDQPLSIDTLDAEWSDQSTVTVDITASTYGWGDGYFFLAAAYDSNGRFLTLGTAMAKGGGSRQIVLTGATDASRIVAFAVPSLENIMPLSDAARQEIPTGT